MLNQCINSPQSDCALPPSLALVPVADPRDTAPADPILSARIARFAAALGHPPPQIVPSAAALLLPLTLPATSDRQRRQALPFVAEPFLAAPLEQMHLTLGTQIASATWLCAAMAREDLEALTEAEGAVLPDILGVPLPVASGHWSIWCAEQIVYVRCDDGGGIALERESFREVWKALGRPELELAHGTPPPGIEIARQMETVPDPDPAIFALDLSISPKRSNLAWRGLVQFAACALLAAVAGHATLARFDAQALAEVSSAQSAALQEELAARGLPSDLALPARAILGAQQPGAGERGTDFLTLLDGLSAGVSTDTTTLRELRFDGNSRSLSAVVTGPSLGSLQELEVALAAQRLTVTTGAATQTETGAELQLTIQGEL